jgi:Xaa-Pro dipeptidase
MVETGQLPEQYDRLVICRLLHGILDKRRLLGSRIGLELDFVDVNTYSALTQVCPQNDFVDSTSLLYDLRSIKNQAEVDALRHACMLTESGIRAAAGQISQGAKVANLAEALLKGIWSAAGEHGLWDELGSITGRPELGGQMGLTENSRVLCAGTTVKFDVQVSVSRYHADVGRTYVAGEPSSAVRRIHRALHGAHTRARDALRPGTRLCDVFRLTLDSIHRAGFSDYRRGHFGHSVGLDPKIEEPPFISATERCSLSPGMVLALETPFYAPGIGMFQLEDMCLISEDGCEVLSCLPRQLEWLRDDM